METAEVMAVLRVQGEGTALAALLEATGRSPDQAWRAGQTDRRGRLRDTSGFSVTLWEGHAPELAAGLHVALLGIAEALERATEGGARLELDLGLFAAEDAVMTSVRVPAELSCALGAYGIELVLSVYRASESTR